MQFLQPIHEHPAMAIYGGGLIRPPGDPRGSNTGRK
jgi:hypothetical protein